MESDKRSAGMEPSFTVFMLVKTMPEWLDLASTSALAS